VSGEGVALTEVEKGALFGWWMDYDDGEANFQDLAPAVESILAARLAAVTAATDDAARHLGHVHPVVLALRKALGAS